MLIAVILSVVMLRFVMLNVVMTGVDILNVEEPPKERKMFDFLFH